MCVRDLDHALGGEAVQRDRDERHRPVEYLATGPVGDPEHRGVAVPDQVHLHVVHVQRVVHLQVVVLRRRSGLALVAEVGIERGRLPHLRPRGHIARGERVEGDAERLQVRRRDQPPGTELIERGHRISKRLAGHQQAVSLVAEQAAHADSGQQRQQRQMEEQVAGLAQVALFRGDPAVAGADPEPLGREQRRRLGQRGARGQRRGHRGGQREAGQVARGPGRLLARGAGQPERPRHHAPGEGEEQQQVDRREPGGREHVEQGEPGQPGGQRRVRGVVLLHRLRVDALLRQHRTRHAAQRQQEQQDQGGAHRGELAPPPPGPFQRSERAWAAPPWRGPRGAGPRGAGGLGLRAVRGRPGTAGGRRDADLGHRPAPRAAEVAWSLPDRVVMTVAPSRG